MKNLRLIFLGAFITACSLQAPKEDYKNWSAYAGSKDAIRYSANDEITPENVAHLEVAWTFSSHDKDSANRSQNQCNPIMVDKILYGATPRSKLVALEAATGKLKWEFDPATIDTSSKDDPYAFYKIIRGVEYWQDEKGADKRIFYGSGSRIYAVNAADGKVVGSFGKGGYIDVSENLDRPSTSSFISVTTPGVIYKDLLITGARVSESADAAPGHIRAYDVRTGERRWIFHTIPWPGEQGYDTWPDTAAYRKLGGANCWAGMSLDERRGIVYIPTGTVSGDFYGGFRKGTNLFGNSLIALDAATGKYLWHYQVVHHDLWDRDLAATPNLVTLHVDGKTIDAVAQITKHGYVFLFDRLTGKPVFPIEERPVPVNGLPGEEPWPTQPVPTLPEPFSRQSFTADDVSDLDAEEHKVLLEKFKQVKYGAMFTPPGKEGSWIFPGFDGGGEWGGSAVDPETGILYVNSSELPWSLTMIDVPRKSGGSKGEGVYRKYCMSCHGAELKGNPPSFPALTEIKEQHTEATLGSLINNGKNMMPAFRQISADDKKELISFLLSFDDKRAASTSTTGSSEVLDEIPYTFTGYNRFLDKDGNPGIKPPWGTLNAVDLNSGKLLWKVPLGEFPELTKKGFPPTGTETYGGPLVTKGGLVFIAGTKDEKIRAFDKKTGKVLWEAPLPASGFATPACYTVNGHQYIVIACGGGKIGMKSGDSYVAFRLGGR